MLCHVAVQQQYFSLVQCENVTQTMEIRCGNTFTCKPFINKWISGDSGSLYKKQDRSTEKEVKNKKPYSI